MGQYGNAAVVVDDGDGFGKIHKGHGHESRPPLAADIPAKIDVWRIAPRPTRPVRSQDGTVCITRIFQSDAGDMDGRNGIAAAELPNGRPVENDAQGFDGVEDFF